MRRGGNQLMNCRGLLVAVIVAIGWLWAGSSAWADTLIDTTACPTNGAANVSSPAGPLEQNEWGNIFVAPTGYLKSYTADLAADGNQAATPSSSQSVTPPAASSSVSTATSSGSASFSASSSGSGSTPSTSSRSVSSDSAAPAASAQRTQSTQPAFGQNGSLGPGRGAAGTQ